jgi:4'-phosphopantetheinyl transferase
MPEKTLSVHALDLGYDMEKYQVEPLLRFVGETTVLRLQRFHRQEDACRTLYGELLARMALMVRESLKNEAIVFSTDSYGKPSCAGKENLYFNISHSDRWVVCALDERPVGVDIERIAPFVEGLEQTCFSGPERRDLQACSGSDRIVRFYSLWTAKESYMKMVGKGMSLPIQSFTIQPGLNGRLELLSGGCDLTPPFFWQYKIDREFCLTVCSVRDAFPSSVKYWTVADINVFFSEYNTVSHEHEKIQTLRRQS